MVTLTHTEACPVHVAHADSITVGCFDEATGMFALAVAETADVATIPDVLRTWLLNDGTENFEVSFFDDFGTEHVITYAV
jgi:hypothetical protein